MRFSQLPSPVLAVLAALFGLAICTPLFVYWPRAPKPEAPAPTQTPTAKQSQLSGESQLVQQKQSEREQGKTESPPSNPKVELPEIEQMEQVGRKFDEAAAKYPNAPRETKKGDGQGVEPALGSPRTEIRSSYDKFDDTTSYRVHLGDFEEDKDYFSLSIRAWHKGEGRTKFRDNQFVSFTVYRKGPKLRYLDFQDVKLMQGRNNIKTIAIYRHEIDDEDHSGKEFFTIHAQISNLRIGLESDKDWEMKIGIDQPIPIGPAARKKIKEFLDYIQAGPSGKEESQVIEATSTSKGFK
jgi:hypothetical protein